jgi:hypothetical protein
MCSTEGGQTCLLGGEESDCGMQAAGRSVMSLNTHYVSAFTSQTGKAGFNVETLPSDGCSYVITHATAHSVRDAAFV